jgi:glycerol-3-phosphate dehydrogenase
MGKIIRDPAGFSKKTYDLIIIGGGIYGVMLAFEASRRGLKSLLVEKADFGGATTFNSLRIIHGGFRYLKNLDLHGFRESVAERSWFLKNLPDLVKPLPCLMPLFGNGIGRSSVVRVATQINDVLSRNRNKNIQPEKHIPSSKIISAKETIKICPLIDTKELEGGAIWYDAGMPDSQRIVIELLRWACGNAADALNYIEAKELLRDGSDVKGISATDLESGETHEFKSNVVINAAGPWSRLLATKFDRDEPTLFKSSIAWNILFNKGAISSHALAIRSKASGERTYFLLPWKGKLLVGTGHAPWFGNAENPKPSDQMLHKFLHDINLALPSLDLNTKDILYVFSGLLPVKKLGTVDLLKREVILNHGDQGGPKGFFSISGVKFTTSRLVAEKTIKQIFTESKVLDNQSDIIFSLSKGNANQRGILNLREYSLSKIIEWETPLMSIIEDESVRQLADLVFQRTNIWENPNFVELVSQHFRYLFQSQNLKHRKDFKLIENKAVN